MFLTDLVWLAVGACLLAACWWALAPRIGDDLEHLADAYLRWRHRTQPDRLARRARQEVGR